MNLHALALRMMNIAFMIANGSERITTEITRMLPVSQGCYTVPLEVIHVDVDCSGSEKTGECSEKTPTKRDYLHAIKIKVGHLKYELLFLLDLTENQIMTTQALFKIYPDYIYVDSDWFQSILNDSEHEDPQHIRKKQKRLKRNLMLARTGHLQDTKKDHNTISSSASTGFKEIHKTDEVIADSNKKTSSLVTLHYNNNKIEGNLRVITDEVKAAKNWQVLGTHKLEGVFGLDYDTAIPEGGRPVIMDSLFPDAEPYLHFKIQEHGKSEMIMQSTLLISETFVTIEKNFILNVVKVFIESKNPRVCSVQFSLMTSYTTLSSELYDHFVGALQAAYGPYGPVVLDKPFRCTTEYDALPLLVFEIRDGLIYTYLSAHMYLRKVGDQCELLVKRAISDDCKVVIGSIFVKAWNPVIHYRKTGAAIAFRQNKAASGAK